MTLQVADRVWDISTTVGSGPIALAGAPPQDYQPFSAVCSNNDTIYVSIANRSANEWEVCLAIYNSAGPSLTITNVLSSSNANAIVTFTAGIKDIQGVWPAAKLNPLNIPAALTRAQIPSGVQASTIIVSGYTVAGDRGAGSIYTSIGAGPSGPAAIQDLSGTWFQLVLNKDVNVGWFGAVGDVQGPMAVDSVTNFTINSGNNVLSGPVNMWAATDVGKTIIVPWAGVANADLVTTISGFNSSNQITLTANASSTVNGPVAIFWGTDDTAAITAAMNAMTEGCRLYFPAGGYLINGALPTITRDFTVVGDAAINKYPYLGGVTGIYQLSLSAITFNVSTANFGKFENIGIFNLRDVPTSASRGILVNNTGGVQQRTGDGIINFEGCVVSHFYNCVDVVTGVSWSMRDCKILAPLNYGLSIQNTPKPDNGDYFISDCTFNINILSWLGSGGLDTNAIRSVAAIFYGSGGGCKITNCKFLCSFQAGVGWDYAIKVDPGVSPVTGQLYITHCSFDGPPVAGISVNNWSEVIITDNFFHLPLSTSTALTANNTQEIYMGGGVIEWNNNGDNPPIVLTGNCIGSVIGPIAGISTDGFQHWYEGNRYPLVNDPVTGWGTGGSPGIPSIRDLSMFTPYPMTTIGTVDPRIPGITAIAINDASIGGAANSMIYTWFTVPRPFLCNGLGWYNGVTSGNYSVGIYKADGLVNPLIGGGVPHAVPAGGNQLINGAFTPVRLYPGILYYAAISFDNTTATFGCAVPIVNFTDKAVTGIPFYSFSGVAGTSHPCPQFAGAAFPPAVPTACKAAPVLILLPTASPS